MKIASVIKIISLGEITMWGKQFLSALQTARLVEITFEPSFQKFSESATVPHVEIVFIESTPESRTMIQRVRSLGRRLYVVWYARNFTKEDVTFAMDQRVFCVLENSRPDDRRLLDNLQRLLSSLDTVEQYEQVLRSLKGVLLQAETEMPKPILTEIKTAVGKLERLGLQNEFNAMGDIVASGDTKLPFARAQDFSDAMNTVHTLERTGVLWVRGRLPTEEGKVEFLQGKIVGANAGEVRGLKAIYRMFLWDDPRFLFTRKDPRESAVVGDQQLNMSMKYLCGEGLAQRKRFEKIRRELPPLDLSLELEPASLHAGTMLDMNEFSTLASVVEFHRVNQVLDYNPLPDVALYEALIVLKKTNVIRVHA